MVKHAQRIQDSTIKPIRLASTPAAANEQLTSLGLGRTKTEWVPNKLHSCTFTLGSVAGSTVNLNGSSEAVVRQGDAGGPTVRMNGITAELVAATMNWNGMLQLARFKSDVTGRDGLLTVRGAGSVGALYAYPTNSEGVLSGASKSMWKNDGSWKAAVKLTTGDFTGDGRADVVVTSGDGALFRYSGNAQGGLTCGVTRPGAPHS